MELSIQQKVLLITLQSDLKIRLKVHEGFIAYINSDVLDGLYTSIEQQQYMRDNQLKLTLLQYSIEIEELNRQIQSLEKRRDQR